MKCKTVTVKNENIWKQNGGPGVNYGFTTVRCNITFSGNPCI